MESQRENDQPTCIVCTDTIVPTDGNNEQIIIDNSAVCRRCLSQLFEMSIQHEANFPPRWGNKILDPHDYLRYQAFNTLFLKSFDEKENEYSCPAKERIYCTSVTNGDGQTCNQFIGRMSATKAYAKCSKCMFYTCLKCRTLFSAKKDRKLVLEKETLDKHHPRCVKISKKTSKDEDAELEIAFGGLKRGKVYQICPNPRCSIRIQLKEACNHITCSLCKTEFCFLCGRKAVRGMGHWSSKRSKCPLYGEAESERGMFEDAVAEEEPQPVGQQGDGEEDGLATDEYERWQMELLHQENMAQAREVAEGHDRQRVPAERERGDDGRTRARSDPPRWHEQDVQTNRAPEPAVGQQEVRAERDRQPQVPDAIDRPRKHQDPAHQRRLVPQTQPVRERDRSVRPETLQRANHSPATQDFVRRRSSAAEAEPALRIIEAAQPTTAPRLNDSIRDEIRTRQLHSSSRGRIRDRERDSNSHGRTRSRHSTGYAFLCDGCLAEEADLTPPAREITQPVTGRHTNDRSSIRGDSRQLHSSGRHHVGHRRSSSHDPAPRHYGGDQGHTRGRQSRGSNRTNSARARTQGHALHQSRSRSRDRSRNRRSRSYDHNRRGHSRIQDDTRRCEPAMDALPMLELGGMRYVPIDRPPFGSAAREQLEREAAWYDGTRYHRHRHYNPITGQSSSKKGRRTWLQRIGDLFRGESYLV